MSPLQSRFNHAIQLHDKGVEGDQEAVKEAFKILKELREKGSSNSLIEAYYGSTVTLLGRDASKNKERLKIANHGLHILDDVVSKDPNHIDIRLLRAYVNSRVPEKYFKRTENAIEDLEYLMNRYEGDSSIFSKDQYEDILNELGKAYKRIKQSKQAKAIFTKLQNQTSDSKNEIQEEVKTKKITKRNRRSRRKKVNQK